jgi:hypothetical protein
LAPESTPLAFGLASRPLTPQSAHLGMSSSENRAVPAHAGLSRSLPSSPCAQPATQHPPVPPGKKKKGKKRSSCPELLPTAVLGVSRGQTPPAVARDGKKKNRKKHMFSHVWDADSHHPTHPDVPPGISIRVACCAESDTAQVAQTTRVKVWHNDYVSHAGLRAASAPFKSAQQAQQGACKHPWASENAFRDPGRLFCAGIDHRTHQCARRLFRSGKRWECCLNRRSIASHSRSY